MKSFILLGAALMTTGVLSTPAMAAGAPPRELLKSTVPKTKAAKSLPTFELFKVRPGKLDEFMHGVAIWDRVSVAGGQPKTQVYLLKSGRHDIYDVLLYKEPRVTPTAAQEAAMAAKIKELGLPTGDAFVKEFLTVVSGSSILEMEGPIDGAEWMAARKR